MPHHLVRGLVAGAAGTVALNVVTYLDMAGRGRASSALPADAAGVLADKLGVRLGTGETQDHRKEGIGALLGYATGLGVGAAYGLVRAKTRMPMPLAALVLGAAAMAGSDAPMTALGLTNPATWPVSSWVGDVVPHLAYGLVTVRIYELFGS